MLDDADASYDPNGAMTASDRYSSAFNTPWRSQVQQDPTQQMSLTAPSVIVSGRLNRPRCLIRWRTYAGNCRCRFLQCDGPADRYADPDGRANGTVEGSQHAAKTGRGRGIRHARTSAADVWPAEVSCAAVPDQWCRHGREGRPLETQMRFDPNTGAAVPVLGSSLSPKARLRRQSATATIKRRKVFLRGWRRSQGSTSRPLAGRHQRLRRQSKRFIRCARHWIPGKYRPGQGQRSAWH